MQKIVIFIKKNYSTLFFVFLFIAFLIFRAPSWIKSYQFEGSISQSFSLPNIDHQMVKVPDELKKPAVLIFWASWCGVCKLELSRIQEAIDSNEISAQHIYGINLGEAYPLVKSAVENRKYTFNILMDPSSNLAQIYKVSALPTVVFINKENQISWHTTGLTPTINYRLRSFLKTE